MQFTQMLLLFLERNFHRICCVDDGVCQKVKYIWNMYIWTYIKNYFNIFFCYFSRLRIVGVIKSNAIIIPHHPRILRWKKNNIRIADSCYLKCRTNDSKWDKILRNNKIDKHLAFLMAKSPFEKFYYKLVIRNRNIKILFIFWEDILCKRKREKLELEIKGI